MAGWIWLLSTLFSDPAAAQNKPTPLVIGDTLTIDSRILGERRQINVYLPPGYKEASGPPLPVLYMPDGGLAEDFLHIAGLVEVLVGDESMRPFLLVGIENTERRRDLTGPTVNVSDRKIAPHVGGSAAFRNFIRRELMPQIKARYRTTAETAIVGESLAGLFVVETLVLEPDLFDSYIAVDPSLWWNDKKLLSLVEEKLQSGTPLRKKLYFAGSSDDEISAQLAALLDKYPAAGLDWHFDKMPDERHSTIYHPAALKAFRRLFKLPGNRADNSNQ